MKAGLITGQEQFELLDFEELAPRPGQVTVDITLCGICGTEVASYRTGAPHSPAVCGHEWVGIVSKVGGTEHEYLMGERVVVSTAPPCGTCPECSRGLTETCRTANLVARGRDPLAPVHGGFAPRITVGAGRVLAADPRLTDVQAAMVEPATVAVHGVSRTGIELGDVVVVMGGGPIGLLAMQVARVAGAGHVFLVEPVAERRDLGLGLGADVTLVPEESRDAILELTGGVGADVVIEATGVASLLQSSVELARVRGTVALLSYVAQMSEVSGAKIMARETRIVGASAFTRSDFATSMNLIATGRVLVDPLVSRTVALADLGVGLAALASGRSGDVKVLVDPRVDG